MKALLAANPRLYKFFPFLNWLPIGGETFRADVVAGITVALVLIPQSMAYAQLAGMPPYYGLYAAFLPVLVGALWGSSNQLATGPVAMVSLLTGSVLAPLAAPGSEQFVAFAILLALMVGILQLALGLFRLGEIVNFLSHPVIVGFTNAAAIVIALSQLNKLLGVPIGRSSNFMQDIWGVLQQIGDTHIPTLFLGLFAFAIMLGFRKYAPKLPGVLIAVAVTTLISWSIGFERVSSAKVESILNPDVRKLAAEYSRSEAWVRELNTQIAAALVEMKQMQKAQWGETQAEAMQKYQLELLKLELKEAERENRIRWRLLRKLQLELASGTESDPPKLYLKGEAPKAAKSDGYSWRIKRITQDELKLTGGGEVIGTIPSGLPGLAPPKLSWDMVTSLLSATLVITLVGFMEAISIAKAMAAKTKQRIDPNQELVGQGLANIVGSFSQCFPASGSFSRSAVNLNAGAKTGLSSVVTGLIVLVTLMFLTPLLYHLPQSVLAAVIMMAVIGLINFKAIKHAWHAHKHDGAAAIVTFIASLVFAPNLDDGILIGGGLAVILFLYRTMKPRVALLGRHPDGTLRDARAHNLALSEHIAAIRFDAALYFANVPYFEDSVLEVTAKYPKIKFILVVGDGINQLDASGEEVIHHLVQRLRENGITMVFSGLKLQILQVMERTGLAEFIGAENIFRTEDLALETIRERMQDSTFDPAKDPLIRGAS